MSATTTPVAPFYTVGEHEFTLASFSALPDSSRIAIVRRGLQHYFGNEQAAKVSGLKTKRRDEIAAWTAESGTEQPKDLTEDEIAAATDGFHTKALKALLDGTVGAGRGPSAPKPDPIESIMTKLAIGELQVILSKNGLKLPTNKLTREGKDAVVEFANGTKLTREQLIARRLAHPVEGPRLRKAAEAEAKARAKAQAAVEKSTEGQDLAEVLGL